MPRQGSTLGFFNRPVSFDNSRTILADQSGANIGRGIENLAQGVFQRAQQKAQEREQKEREKQQREVLGPLIEELSGGKIKASDLAAEDLPMAMTIAQNLQQQQTEAALQPLQVENAQLRNELMRSQVAASRAPSRVGEVRDIRGVPFVFQNEGQLVPLPQPGQTNQKPTEATQLLNELGAVANVTPEERAKVLRQAIERQTAPRSSESNPFIEAQRTGLQGQIAQLQNEITQLRQSEAEGNKRRGPDWLPIGKKISEVVLQKTQQLELLKQQLRSLGGGGGTSPEAQPAPQVDAVEPEIDPDAFFSNLGA